MNPIQLFAGAIGLGVCAFIYPDHGYTYITGACILFAIGMSVVTK